jgi:hypothetical protein
MSGRAARAAKVRKRLLREKIRRELMLAFRGAVMKAFATPLISNDSPLLQYDAALTGKFNGYGRVFYVLTRPETR